MTSEYVDCTSVISIIIYFWVCLLILASLFTNDKFIFSVFRTSLVHYSVARINNSKINWQCWSLQFTIKQEYNSQDHSCLESGYSRIVRSIFSFPIPRKRHVEVVDRSHLPLSIPKNNIQEHTGDIGMWGEPSLHSSSNSEYIGYLYR